MDKSKLYINEDEVGYLEFLKNKQEKTILDKRINTLEAIIKELMNKITALETKNESGGKG